MKLKFIGLAIALAAIGTSPVAAQTLRNVNVIALTDQESPTTGEFYRFLGRPSINDSGVVSFYAFLKDSGGTATQRGVFSGSTNPLLATVGLGADLGGVTTIDSAGQVGFSGNGGYWLGAPGSASSFAQNGGLIPGSLSDEFYTGLTVIDTDGRFRHANNQKVAFISNLTGAAVNGSNDSILIGGDSSSLQVIARRGGLADDIGGDAVFANFYDVTAGGGGHIAFSASISGTEIASANDEGIWSGTPGNITLLARQGSQAAGLMAGTTYGNQMSDPRINDAGHVVFESNFFGTETGKGLWAGTPESLQLVATSDDIAVAGDAGNFQNPVINSDGDVAFHASYPGVRYGMWSNASGSLELIAMEDEQAAGIGGDAKYDLPLDLALNSNGQIAFAADLLGSDVDGTNDNGLWAQDANGVLRLIARAGDKIEVGPSDIRTIDHIFFINDSNAVRSSSGDDGFPSGFDDLGQLAFLVSFTDHTEAIVVASVVPEPSTLVLAALGLVALAIRRNRH